MRRSALFGLLLAGGAVVADQWADQWVADHNAARAKYGLAPVTWDAQAAATAQAWADKCNFAHGGGGGYGQNIWMSSGSGTCNLGDIQGSTSSWMSEAKSWTCGKDMWGDGCAGGWANCGHLTQVLWEKTTAIGCACGSTCKLVVCNYNPAGNFVGQQPFPASKCNGAPQPDPTTGNPNPQPNPTTDGPTPDPTTGNDRPTGRPTARPTARPTGWGGNNTDHHGRPTARPTGWGGNNTDHGRPTARPTGWGGNNTDHHGRPTARPTDHGGRPTDHRPPWGGGDRPTGRPTERPTGWGGRPTDRPPWGGGGRGGGGRGGHGGWGGRGDQPADN